MSQATVRFHCPQCNKLYSTPVELAGKTITCKCGMKVTIPAVSQAVGPPPKQPAATLQPQLQTTATPVTPTLAQPIAQSQYQPILQPQYQQTQVPPNGMNQPTKFCHACGQPIDARAEICPKCGVRQPGMSAGGTGGSKNRLMAALLALFLGGLGVHHFYLGRPIMGVIYLLFCWTFIPALIAFIEAIVLLCTSDEAFHRKYPD